MEFGEIKRLIWDGHFDEASSLIQSTSFSNSLDKDFLILILYHCQFNILKKHEFLLDILSRIDSNVSDYHKLISLLCKEYIGRIGLSQDEHNQIKKIYTSISGKLGEDWQHYFNFIQSYELHLNEKQDEALIFATRSMELAQKIDFPQGVIDTYDLISKLQNPGTDQHVDFGNTKKVLEKGFKYAGEKSRELLTLELLSSLTIYSYAWVGQYNESLSYAKRGLEISQIHNLDFWNIHFLESMVGSLLQLGKVEEAHKRNTSAFEAANRLLNTNLKQLSQNELINLVQENVPLWMQIEWLLQGAGKIAYMVNKHIKAINYFQTTLALRYARQTYYKKHSISGNPFIAIGYTIVQLVNVLVKNGRIDEVPTYIELLKELNNQNPNNHYIPSKLKLAQSILLKKSTRMKNKVEAQELLKTAISNGIPDANELNLATYHLCDLLIEEFQLYGDMEVYTEATQLLDKIVDKSKQQQNVIYQVEAIILRSQFSLIEGDYEKTVNYLDEAFELASNKQNPSLIKRVNDERSNLLSEIEKWKLINLKNLSVQEKLHKVKIQSYISKALDIIEKT